MAVKVTVNSIPTTRVSINTEKRDTIRTVGIVPALTSIVTTSLDSLTDVNASDADNNEVLVYDASTQKYVVKELPIVNGGTF